MTTAGITFFLSSGFPFFTVATIMSPAPAAGSLFKRPFMPFTAMTYKFLAPVLSAQLMTAPTGRPREMRNFAPAAPPRPQHEGSPLFGDTAHTNCELISQWSRTQLRNIHVNPTIYVL
uniref:Putative secreted protein n=1 Tax=Ixodes ricinus TaxID=34613 RepID=A0A147BWH9_IXORI